MARDLELPSAEKIAIGRRPALPQALPIQRALLHPNNPDFRGVFQRWWEWRCRRIQRFIDTMKRASTKRNPAIRI
jgi:hypothetical protein